MQLYLFDFDTSEHRAEPGNPFDRIQGVNLFGQRALFVGGWVTCAGCGLIRLGYTGGAA